MGIKKELDNLNERLGYIERIIHYLVQDSTIDPTILEKINRCVKEIKNTKDDWDNKGYELKPVDWITEDGNTIPQYDE